LRQRASDEARLRAPAKRFIRERESRSGKASIPLASGIGDALDRDSDAAHLRAAAADPRERPAEPVVAPGALLGVRVGQRGDISRSASG